MRELDINGRKFPFHVSPAAAKIVTEMMAKNAKSTMLEGYDQNGDKIPGGELSMGVALAHSRINTNIETLYLGLKHARSARPFLKRWYFIPSRKRLSKILSNSELERLVAEESTPESHQEGASDEQGKKN